MVQGSGEREGLLEAHAEGRHRCRRGEVMIPTWSLHYCVLIITMVVLSNIIIFIDMIINIVTINIGNICIYIYRYTYTHTKFVVNF